jgi:HPt (histidine-containing phosphotransfer) domain-containing protein
MNVQMPAKRKIGRVDASRQAPKQDAALDKVLVWNFAQALERLGGDEELLDQLVDIFLQEIPGQMARLRESVEQADANAIQKLAHNLKGEFGYLGASNLSELARAMETLGNKCDLQNAARLFAVLETGINALVAAMGDRESIPSETNTSARSFGAGQ